MTKNSRSLLPPQLARHATPRMHSGRFLEGLVKLSAAAKIRSVSPITVRRRVRDGSLTAVRITGRLYFGPAELRAFIACHREN